MEIGIDSLGYGRKIKNRLHRKKRWKKNTQEGKNEIEKKLQGWKGLGKEGKKGRKRGQFQRHVKICGRDMQMF